MTAIERKHLREASRIVRTIFNHHRGIDVDGSYRSCGGADRYLENERANWSRIMDMIFEWVRNDS